MNIKRDVVTQEPQKQYPKLTLLDDELPSIEDVNLKDKITLICDYVVIGVSEDSTQLKLLTITPRIGSRI